MNRRLRFVLLGLAALAVVSCLITFYVASQSVNLRGSIGAGRAADLTAPPGFVVTIFAEGLNGPRFLAFGPDGVLYAADRRNNRIVALPDQDGDGVADEIRVFAADLTSPHSLVHRDGAWYVGVPSGVVRLEDTDADGAVDERIALISDYPTSGHSTRTVLFLPDGRMVVSVGSSCNVCLEEDSRRAAVVVYDGPEATGERVFAAGLRNAVGLAVHPQTGELWATNNGRDFMGDELPPDTVDIVREGADHGWPRCHSGRIPDPEFGEDGACDGVVPPIFELQAHSAPLGLAFYAGELFPAEYQGDLFVAYHGSWNRSVPTGYKVVRLPLDGSHPAGPAEDFVVGWLNERTGAVAGRPVGLAVGPDGALYISDDRAGLIYRVSYEG